MKNISDLIARKEYLPMPEDVQRELEEMSPERRVEEDSRIQQFASGMISGAIAAPLMALGPLGTMAAPSIMSVVGGRIKNVQVFDGTSRLLTKSKHNKNNPTDVIHEPGVTTYIVGMGIFGLGAALSSTPLGPILIGLGLGMIGTGISTAGEAGAEQARRNRRK